MQKKYDFLSFIQAKLITMKIAFFLNFRALCIGKPSKTFVQFWLYEEDPERARQVNPHPEWKGGKWMMFFESPNIDKKWERAVILYRQGTQFRN